MEENPPAGECGTHASLQKVKAGKAAVWEEAFEKEESLEFDSSAPHLTDQVTKMNNEAGRQSVEEGPGRLVIKNRQYVLSWATRLSWTLAIS